ncbi:MAG TPA: PaaI family thioesterase [Candidatus Agrococcus pullicola]|uniref:PaaI family thioesterase n=1 Tax=Candidatus Agrococcus pullicola TaxID=2838429 RepID=A0A9D1YZF9_9MICO|nr:PaaI family thioesterase [Candidatus Agrococcus pullicola]
MTEMDEQTRQFLESQGAGELGDRMGIEFTKLSPEHSIARMPAEGNRQPVGLVHGGAYCVIGESLGSVSANIHAVPLGKYAVGVDINATHTRSIREGWVNADCRAVHLGRSMCVHEIVCTDDDGKRLSTIRITNFLKDR